MIVVASLHAEGWSRGSRDLKLSPPAFEYPLVIGQLPQRLAFTAACPCSAAAGGLWAAALVQTKSFDTAELLIGFAKQSAKSAELRSWIENQSAKTAELPAPFAKQSAKAAELRSWIVNQSAKAAELPPR